MKAAKNTENAQEQVPVRAVRDAALANLENAWAGYANAVDQAVAEQAVLESYRQRNAEGEVRYASGLVSFDNSSRSSSRSGSAPSRPRSTTGSPPSRRRRRLGTGARQGHSENRIMKKLLIAILVLAALIGGGAWALRKSKFSRRARRSKPSPSRPASPRSRRPSTPPAPSRRTNRVEVKPTISGRIEKLLVDEGQMVKQGQIIAWMSSTDRAAILDGARAQGPEALKKWEDTYKATPIIAPLPGLIILRNVVEGQTVDSTVVIYAMSDLLIVVAQVDESDIGKVHVGMPAQVILDSYPNKKTMGKVFDILYEGKNVSNVIQYSVKIRLDKVPAYYRSQMTANISFIVRKKDKALLVPAAAVREKDGVKQVLTPPAEEGGRDVWKDVKTGIENDTSVEIVSGLEEGDTVLIRQMKYTPQQALANSPLTATTPNGRRPQQRRGPRRALAWR